MNFQLNRTILYPVLAVYTALALATGCDKPSRPAEKTPAEKPPAEKTPAEKTVAKRIVAKKTVAMAPVIEVTFASKIHPGPYSGRIWLLSNRDPKRPPRRGPGFMKPRPFLSVVVKNLAPGKTLVLDGRSAGYPGPLSTWPKGAHRVQAVMSRATWHRPYPSASGNHYSKVGRLVIGERTMRIRLHIHKTVRDRPTPADPRLKHVKLHSPLLTAHYKRPTFHRAAVLLPPRRVQRATTGGGPTVYHVHGFGSGADKLLWLRKHLPRAAEGFTHVMLDANCPTGHHMFVNSPTNGPWATALVKELIPHLERTFGLAAVPRGRFLTGVSSGGWSVLWLQLSFPDFFNGAWSVAPDPVDFRAVMDTDVYAKGANIYRDSRGKLRPLARVDGKVVWTVRDYVAFEIRLGRGGQFETLDAVWSPRSSAGVPRPLFDRRTGAVDPTTARQWRAYDIRAVVQRIWKVKGPGLRGKLHIIVGDKDEFGLDRPVRLLQKSLASLGHPLQITYVKNAGHFNVSRKPVALQRYRAMMARWRAKR